MTEAGPRMVFPPAPPGGGTLVLNPAQFSNEELRAAIARVYPQTRVVENRTLAT